MFCGTRWVEDQGVAERALLIWGSVQKTMKFWETLSKSKRPRNKSYECLLTHYNDPLIPAKFQFFSLFLPAHTTEILGDIPD